MVYEAVYEGVYEGLSLKEVIPLGVIQVLCKAHFYAKLLFCEH